MILLPLRQATPRTHRFEARANGLLGDCRLAFHAFAPLSELAEDLRILSLNAELAAGRAGDKGRAVRALTQYTRELVNRLTQLHGEMEVLRERTFALSSATLRGLQHLGLFERACVEEGAGAVGIDAFCLSMANLVETLDAMAIVIGDLGRRTRNIEEVVSQSDSIATNIAIEASAAEAYEMEFRTVAETMRRYVDDLRKMVEDASDAVLRATDRGEGLRNLGLESLDELKTFDKAMAP